MAIQSLSRASIANANRKYNTALAGNPLYTDMELIQTYDVTSASQAAYVFSAIPQTYKHLQVRITGRFNSTASSTYIFSIYLNGYDGVSNSARHSLECDGTSVTSAAGSSVTNIWGGYIAMNNYPTNAFSANIIDILDYSSTTKNKTIREMGGVVSTATSTSKIALHSGFKNTTNAVTSLEISSDNGSIFWMAGSRLSLYGIKG